MTVVSIAIVLAASLALAGISAFFLLKVLFRALDRGNASARPQALD